MHTWEMHAWEMHAWKMYINGLLVSGDLRSRMERCGGAEKFWSFVPIRRSRGWKPPDKLSLFCAVPNSLACKKWYRTSISKDGYAPKRLGAPVHAWLPRPCGIHSSF